MKDPKLVIESDNNSNINSNKEDSETMITESSKPTDKSTTENESSKLTKRTFPKDESIKLVEDTTIELALINQRY
jgi:hypothetical protein